MNKRKFALLLGSQGARPMRYQYNLEIFEQCWMTAWVSSNQWQRKARAKPINLHDRDQREVLIVIADNWRIQIITYLPRLLISYLAPKSEDRYLKPVDACFSVLLVLQVRYQNYLLTTWPLDISMVSTNFYCFSRFEQNGLIIITINRIF